MSESKISIYLVEHSQCNGDGLVDCSLTKEGMYQADTDLPPKLFSDRVIQELDVVNIYCSPTLRTVQTIIPFIKGCSRQNKIPVLIFDDSISDIMNGNIGHYFTMKNKPRFVTSCPYDQEINMIMDIISCVNDQDYITSRKYTKLLIVALTGIIGNSINIVNKILIYLDRNINSTTHHEHMLYQDSDAISDLCDIITQLYSFGVNEFVSSDYEQVVDLNNYNAENIMAGCTEETIDMLAKRTNEIVLKMLTCDTYKNSIYVTHKTVIASIMFNMLQYTWGELFWEKLAEKFGPDSKCSLKTKYIIDYCRCLEEGCVTKITIDIPKKYFAYNKL